MAKIIIGIDGSDNSKRALLWALEHSNPDDELVAVGTWTYPIIPDGFLSYVPPVDIEPDVTRRLTEFVHAIADPMGRTINVVVQTGHAGNALITASESADMLVVGSRGHGGFTGLLLGSVSTYCVHHAKCPVVVVPAPD